MNEERNIRRRELWYKRVKNGEMKQCKHCNNIKPLSDFSLECIYCRECRKINRKDKYNKEQAVERSRQWKLNNKDRFDKWFEDNKERRNKEKNIRRKERMQNDPVYFLRINMSKVIMSSLKRQGYTKKSRAHEILGIDFEGFKEYIENKFEPWMTWENHGKYNGELNYGWDLDHIIPISSAKNEEEIIKLNHYSNFQPLCSFTNRYIKKDNI